MDAVEVPAGDLQVTRLLGTAGQCNRVEFLDQGGDGGVSPDLDASAEFDAFGPHLADAAVDARLEELCPQLLAYYRGRSGGLAEACRERNAAVQ